MADRVVLMREGVIQQIADPDTLFQEPANLFVAGFIGSPGMNLLNADITRGGDSSSIEMFKKQVPIKDHDVNGTSDVIVGIRPEHLSLGDGPVSFKIRPSLVESLGSEKYIYFQDDAHQLVRNDEDETSKGLIARVPHAGALREGEELTLSFDPTNLHLFDAHSERAL